MNIKKYFGDRQFYKTALLVAVPIMIQNGITNLVNMLDNIMVGAVGTVPMSGVSISNTIMFVFNLSVFGAMSGAGIFTAQFYGNDDHEGVRYTQRYKLIVGLLLAIVGILVLALFGEPLIKLYLTGEGNIDDIEASLAFGRSYMMIMLAGIPAFVISQCYASTMRETGQTITPMIAGICAVVINLSLNWILIFGKLGAPALGSNGAAIATVISRYTELAIVVCASHFNTKKNPYIKGLFKSFYIPKKLLGGLISRGTPLMVNEALWAGGMALLTQSYSLRGYDVVGAVNICNALTNVTNVSFLAMGSAIGILVGQRLGAGDIEGAKDTDRKLIVFALITSVIPITVLLSMSKIFPQIYDTTESVRSLACSFILISAAIAPFACYANSVYFTLRCGGKTIITVIFDSVFTCLIVAPLAFVLSRFTSMPIIPLYFCCQGLEIIKCIVGTILLRSGLWINTLVE